VHYGRAIHNQFLKTERLRTPTKLIKCI